jgi:thiol-disulfide isomerase/thioredoxin
MKNFLTLLFLFTIHSFIFSQSKESAELLIKNASEKAKKENKNVFVKFSASWCIWCTRMDGALHDITTEKIFDNQYVFQTLVVMESKGKEHLENPGGNDMMTNLGGAEMGLPFWVILSPDGKILANSKEKAENMPLDGEGENVGCPAKESEINYFLRVLRGTSNLKEKDLNTIKLRFEKIDIERKEAEAKKKK